MDNVITKLPDYQSFCRKTKLRLNPDRIPNLHLEFVHHTKYNSNLNDTTITHMDKHSLFEYTQKEQVIIFLTVRFIKTHRLKIIVITFSIAKLLLEMLAEITNC